MANGASSIVDLCLAFEKEERRREKKQDALELEWLAWDNAQEALAVEREAKELEAAEQEAKDPERKEAERKEADRARRSAQIWEGAWVVAGGSQRKKKARRKEES
ncbi:MAG: hypothetical protein EBT07_11920 [Actinobacteria bacterium]|nr:hypothetical protein [Actinomycetota bacterium]